MEADLIFRGATVVDGTGGPAFAADVAVAGDRILAVGGVGGMGARREVAAEGRVLCPGFVDMHGHSDYFLLALPTAESKVKQGVTTELGGNCGYTPAPVRGEVKEERKTSHRELYGLTADWEDFPEYLERLEKARPAINFAPQVGFNTVRASVMNHSARPATAVQLAEMKSLIRESLAAGVFGLSLGLIYAPGCFAGTEELVECAKEAGWTGALVSSHIRSEGGRLEDAVAESLEIAERAGVRFEISHLKTSGRANWGKLDRVFELIEGGRARGLAVTADRYPYLASFTQLSSALPEWVFEGGKERFYSRLADASVRQRLREELSASDPAGDRWRRIVVAQVFRPDLSRWEGKSVEEGAREQGTDPLDFLCWLVTEAADRASAVYHTMSEDNLRRIYEKEWVMIGSDAAARSHEGPTAEGKPHPRAFGTMPRVLSWAVREKGWFSLTEAVYKMTLLPSRTIGLPDRGRLAPGLAADLVLFDPENIADRATYDHPHQYPIGIEMVVVNGKITVENGELTGVRAGRVLRRKP